MKSAELICSRCEKKIGLFGRLTYDKRTGLCGACGTTGARSEQYPVSEAPAPTSAERTARFVGNTNRLPSVESGMRKLSTTQISGGTILHDRYHVAEELGRGGMGAVCRATDERTNKIVALKRTLAETDELRRAFKREADLLTHLSHPSLPKVTDHFFDGTEQYIVMDFVPGDDIRTLMEEGRARFRVDEILRWADELLDALAYMHGHQPPIVHRDIKPANLKVAADRRIVLLDFGLAKGSVGDMTRGGNTQSLYGYTPHYAPPEQIQGDSTSPRSDLYALGATIHHLLTGQKPEDALTRLMQVAQRKADPLPPIARFNSAVPSYVAEAVCRAMSLDPTERPADAAAMRAQLQRPGDVPAQQVDPDEAITLVQTPPSRAAYKQISDIEGLDVEEMIRSASVVRTDKRSDLRQQDQADESGARRLYTAPSSDVKATPPVLDYELPGLDLLRPPALASEDQEDVWRENAGRLAAALSAFNIDGRVEYISPGPVFVTYEYKAEPLVPTSRIARLKSELAASLRSEHIEVEPVPGKPHVAITVTNAQAEIVALREVLASRAFVESASPLTIAMGKTIDGLNYVANLARMPHLLIAGGTGSGKSVFLDALILSILYKARPDEAKLLLIDTKQVQFTPYAYLPHLVTPVITEAARAATALGWAVAEVERRYAEMSQVGAGDIDGYNIEVRRRDPAPKFDRKGDSHKTLPYLVIIIDELTELLRNASVESSDIARLAERGRGVGVHLVIATQRPSSDFMSSDIKAAFNSRIAFRVASKADSRLIIDDAGAERLFGRGDMWFLPLGMPRRVRLQGAYVDTAEIAKIVAHVRAQGIAPVDDVAVAETDERVGEGADDELYDQALRICVEMKRASTSVLVRRLRIGYGRAAAILDGMERDGLIGAADGSRPRPVLGRAYEIIARWDEIAR